MRKELEERVTRSVLLIRHAYRHCKHRGIRLELAYSGGKDSDVLVELCKMGGVWGDGVIRPIYRNTTIDPSGTIKHCQEVGVEILRSRMSFRDCIVRSGYPSRFQRHCCGELKEFRVEDYVLVGIRRCESAARMKNYKEPEVCRSYNGRGKVVQFLPLLEWSDEDVRDFVNERGIRCHSLYYDDCGVFHVERRLGCIGCPLASRRNRIEDFRRHPRFVKFWVDAGAEFMRLHPNSRINGWFGDAFDWFVCNLFYDSIEAFRASCYGGGLFGGGVWDSRAFLESEFGISF